MITRFVASGFLPCSMSIDQEAPVPRSQLVDYDRFNNSLTKLRDKKEKSLNDEKNLFKVCFV